MRMFYEAPKVTVVGSINDLTLGVNLAASGDSLLGFPVPGGNLPLS
jgi:hypothetical protein